MPYFTLQFQPSGPQLDLYVAASVPREQALIKAQVAVPQPILTKGLLDTGASQTCVDPDIIQRLGLQPTGVTSVLTPSTGAVPHQAKTYDVRLIIPAITVSWNIPALAVKPPMWTLKTVCGSCHARFLPGGRRDDWKATRYGERDSDF